MEPPLERFAALSMTILKFVEFDIKILLTSLRYEIKLPCYKKMVNLQSQGTRAIKRTMTTTTIIITTTTTTTIIEVRSVIV